MYKTMMLVLILGMTSVMAQDASTKYLQSKLTVEIESRVIASYNEWEQYLSSSFRTEQGNITMKESRKWKSYQGGFKISESDFFSIAGFHPQATAAKKLASQKSTLDILGIGSLLVGFGICALASDGFSKTAEELESGKEALVYGGFGLVCVSITLGIVRIGLPNKKFPVAFAVEVADEYNRKLRESLE